MDLKEIWFEDIEYIHVVEDRASEELFWEDNEHFGS
jgi:hypothetical protein